MKPRLLHWLREGPHGWTVQPHQTAKIPKQTIMYPSPRRLLVGPVEGLGQPLPASNNLQPHPHSMRFPGSGFLSERGVCRGGLQEHFPDSQAPAGTCAPRGEVNKATPLPCPGCTDCHPILVSVCASASLIVRGFHLQQGGISYSLHLPGPFPPHLLPLSVSFNP